MKPSTDIVQDWPADPENDDLLRLAEQLQASAPTLPESSLVRVEQQMQTELARSQRWNRRKLLWRFSAAAAILLAIALGAYFWTRGTGENPPQHNLAQQPEPLIEDRITVTIGHGGGVPVTKPLLRLDDYRSLYTN